MQHQTWDAYMGDPTEEAYELAIKAFSIMQNYCFSQ